MRVLLTATVCAFLSVILPGEASTAAPKPASQSAYEIAPDDPRAIRVQGRGDGIADDTAAIQAAIDQAKGGGIVFLPSGRYRLTRSLNVWPAVRIFGVGPKRPVFVLADNTPGFQTGVASMIVFTGDDQYNVGKVPVPVASFVPYSETIRDANSSTFYSAMSNVDFEIGQGNPAATAVRFRMAQHAFLSHIDFHLGSALAGIYQAGNEGDNLRFFGGRYGILTEKTSPAWQYTLLDSEFDGQSEAAIREHEVDLTLVNVKIRNTKTGIEIDEGYSDSLWGKDVRFENLSNAAVVISNEDSVFTQVGFDNAQAKGVQVFARFRESGKTVAGSGPAYIVKSFTHGLTLPALGATGTFETRVDAKAVAKLPAARPPALKLLPAVKQWKSARDLGAKGDGIADDTAALQAAIDKNRVVYLPAGHYRVSDTLRLRPDSVLIALHPSLTQIYLEDSTPNYLGVGGLKPMIESARGGNAILFGFGLYTGGYNPRASALVWMAGVDSMVNDVKIQGGSGTRLGHGKRMDMSDPKNRWDGQYPSIWVKDGGGGTFNAVWTPNTFSQAGLYVTNTKTPGYVYQMSAEHHVRAEIVLDGVENWEFLAPQTEQEVRDGLDALSTEIRNSRNILFANYHGYRVTRSLKPAYAAVKLYNASDIRFRNVHVNAESGYATCDDAGCTTYLRASKFPFENAIVDVNSKAEVREREFAVLDVPATPKVVQPDTSAVKKIEGGFYSISGAATAADGTLYFVERQFHRIYSWSAKSGLSIVRDAPLDPVNLAVADNGDILVLSSEGPAGNVYSFNPKVAGFDMALVAKTPVAARKDARTLLPGNFWNNGEFRDQLDPKTLRFATLAELFARDVQTAKTHEYVSKDGSLVLPAFRMLQQGPTNHLGWRWSDTLQTYGFTGGKIGERIVFTNGSENKTYSGVVAEGGALSDLKVIANRGGESAVLGPDGKLYVANGQVFIYDSEGKEVGRIDTPERPLQLIFGGPDMRTLFILSHHGLYAIER
ncbi:MULTISPECIES: glycosyl hydrolase family 28-related protein [Asticcacaulis]|uniref:glycosyl hydrolase family 28-related protein n=1 Tax=Asticcacaulis TaxID=76890 RepID=UPI001AE0FB59|nr:MULTISPECIES: glycosyl hydrolase family 28-related protein [Asticcacaulis]MBP2157931.1 hypothetical protein [Asticcacaulis solisilvae]MDR6798976.1 hypothetical protein [Asticcacaulis sp. BE141]